MKGELKMRLEINHEVKNFCKKFGLTHIQLADEFEMGLHALPQ